MNRLIFIVYFFLLQNFCNAQLLTNNVVQLTINPNVQITIKGDILNNNGTVIDNNGTIDLTGNWINNSGSSIFGTSAGTVIMNGINQNIGGINSTAFYNLHLYNGIKTLQSDIATGGNGPLYSGILNCNDAILDLNSNTLSVNNPVSFAITHTSGYILSEDIDNSSRVWWTNVGTGVHSIPFGNAAGEDVSFAFTCSPPLGSTGGSLRVSTYATVPGNTPYPTTPVLVTHVHDLNGFDNSANMVDRFWHVEKTGVADYYFTYAPSENAANGNTNMRAQRWDIVFYAWNAPLTGQSNPTAQQVYVPNVQSYNQFVMEGATWAVTLESSPLPVELLFFTASEKNNASVECEWSTASEINNDYFILMRSRDGLHFEEAGNIDGAGNSTSVINYSFTDEHPHSGISYYQLKQVDFNGGESFSKIVKINLEAGNPGFSVYPNPAEDNLLIHFNSGASGKIFFTLQDVSGKIVRHEILDGNILYHSVSVRDLAAGFYFLNVNNGETGFIEKIQIIN